MLDLEGIAVTPTLSELAGKIGADDPYVKSVRIGRYKPDVTREQLLAIALGRDPLTIEHEPADTVRTRGDVTEKDE